ncbi:sigma intracellular receptor 2-like isoform X2 [Triticum dicoccoides]|uniref:sigma intracellular receptor 2-like isoform X2 n=1 Tax=Triticum dicoccoides TaxID=85692 RepID=UPI00084283E4|nr:sigma intracellular receptor 2-like isoform X2 [Triticum dicoccoides]XP_044347457.1 sigma intracellular receptor 2-like isoform X2 [Triticum aestivum]
MGAVSATADVVVALFSLIMAVAAPLFDSQIVLPRGLHPAPLVDIHRWFTVAFGHYLVADPPPFFLGLVWLDLAFLWPVCVANLYGILARRRWSAATSLMAGVYMLTYLVVNLQSPAYHSCVRDTRRHVGLRENNAEAAHAQRR